MHSLGKPAGVSLDMMHAHIAIIIPLLLCSFIYARAVDVKNCNNSDTIPQYFLLKEKLLELENAVGRVCLEKINFESKDSVEIFSDIKKKLIQLGYTPDVENTQNERKITRNMILAFQMDHGLRADGIMDKEFKTAINLSISTRIKKIRINLERAANLPPMEIDQVMINIPTFEMEVYDHDTVIMKSDIIVGKRKTKTASIFGRLEYIVFNPYWNIPNSILKKEILPELHKYPNYLIENDMEWIGTRLRQRPGIKNALGRIKFIFPNPYNMYLHDTPNKYLFNRQKRMFSHGCIRIAKPVEFATYLLGKELNSWTHEDVLKKMWGDKELYIKLDRKVNIMVYYMTAFVGKNGRLNYRNDIYGVD